MLPEVPFVGHHSGWFAGNGSASKSEGTPHADGQLAQFRSSSNRSVERSSRPSKRMSSAPSENGGKKSCRRRGKKKLIVMSCACPLTGNVG